MINNEEYFNNKIKVSLNALKEVLINGFIEIFGESNKEKIIDVVNNVNIGIFGPNLSFEEIENNIKLCADKLETKEELSNMEESIYQYEYYKKLKDLKKNNDDNFVLLYSYTPNYDEEFNVFADYYIKSHKATVGKGGCITHTYIGITGDSECKIKLRCFIHEIIHVLMHENLITINENEYLKTLGRISNGKSKYKVINELFVEYYANEVLENILFNSKLKENFIFDLNFIESSYIKIDKLCNNIGKRIFELLRPIHDERIINGEDDFIVRIIGYEQLSNLEYFMDNILEKYLNFSSETPMDEIFSKEEQEVFKSYSDRIYEEIENNYMEYLEVCRLEDEYVTKLEEQGIVRRV